jgi:stearoyl-CoA desaturase (delta-9 desaturase)
LHRLGLATGLRRAREEDIITAMKWMKKHGHEHSHANHAYSSSESSTSISDNEVLSSDTEEDKGESEQRDEACCGEVLAKLTERDQLPTWDEMKVQEYVRERAGRCVLVIGGWVVDATEYMGEHVRICAQLIRLHTLR